MGRISLQLKSFNKMRCAVQALVVGLAVVAWEGVSGGHYEPEVVKVVHKVVPVPHPVPVLKPYPVHKIVHIPHIIRVPHTVHVPYRVPVVKKIPKIVHIPKVSSSNGPMQFTPAHRRTKRVANHRVSGRLIGWLLKAERARVPYGVLWATPQSTLDSSARQDEEQRGKLVKEQNFRRCNFRAPTYNSPVVKAVS